MTNKKRPYDITSENNPVLEAAFAHYGRHLVSLIFRADPIDRTKKPRCLGLSGQIISVGGKWCLLTAGHIVRDLEKLVKSDKEKISFRITACFGPGSKPDSYEFDYEAAPKVFVYQDGLDFGLIAIRPFYENLLRADGVIAIDEKHWIGQQAVECDEHLMMGLPTELMEMELIETNDGYQVNAGLTPTMMRVQKLDNPPPNAPTSKYPQFVGQLGNGGVDNIDGMSGSPIFGINTKQMDRYWVVAVQSSWLPTSRVNFATPLPVIGQFIEELMKSDSEG